MLREEYEKIVYEAAKRLAFLSDVVAFMVKHSHTEHRAMQVFVINDLRSLREKLWEPQEEEGKFITKCIKSLEDCERDLRRNDVHAAWTSINSAYGFISRISVKLQDVNDEMRYIERAAMWKGVTFGTLIGFIIGFSAFFLNLVLYAIGR